MSSYWAGYSGTGLVLNGKEFDKFLENYKERNPEQVENLDEVIEDKGMEEVKFIKSVQAGKHFENLQEDEEHDLPVFYFTVMDNGSIDGFALWPFFRPDGRMNISEKKQDGSYEHPIMRHPMWEDDKDERCYVLFSERDFTSPKVFMRPAYASYEEFKQEFILQVGGYLPEDFDWDAHLGYFSYACYA